MNLEEDLSGALDRHEQRMAFTLSDAAAASYATGQTIGIDRMGITLDFRLVSQAALEYGKKYRELMVEEGATMINEEKVAWASRLSKEERAEVDRIIQEGIKAGKPTGKKESSTGRYPKNSIASDLQEYFDARKSHASTVARSEVARIQNEGKLDSYERWGFGKVRVRDGGSKNSCPTCNKLWGRVWTLAYARKHALEHPNCGRDFSMAGEDEEAFDSTE